MIVRALAALLVLAGLAQVVQGGWVHAKAALASLLLERAWQRTRVEGDELPPWPWADTWPVARLRLPGHGLDAVVLEGASGRVLAFAPGHLQGSAEPGAVGACVIAGHRDTHFRALEHLAPGDLVELDDRARRRHLYRVEETVVVQETDVEVLQPRGGPELILVTCWPFDALAPGGPERFLVRATAVTPTS